MAFITTILCKPNSLPFSPLQRVTTTRTRPSPSHCKVLNLGFNQPQRKHSPSHSSLVTRSRWEASAVEKEADQEEKSQGRIWFSNVVVQNRRQAFWKRNWTALDITPAGVILSMHLLALCAPFNFTWPAFWVAAGLYLRDPIDWVSTHRCHHQFCDTERDPHSPINGFWFSHMNWIFDTKTIIEKRGESSNVEDLEKQPFYRFLQTTYFLHPIALGVVLYALGGFPFLVWGMGVRNIWVYHITWLVNSASHVWGNQAWNTGDLSKNNWWVALLALGEGWHSNHHAFEYSARHGLEWWQLDLTWYIIKFLQVIGLATEVKLPSQVHKQKMAFNN
ncbi:hypothetical protein HRI_001872900 [Hibiscus trionum]|uniref:Fatty acid desaturase domain-containing protein n=1 Tax=Hibiscus trionum TaxID=183268 RepID=A0A9W7HRE3_HIBTR|nr:hypothetical protein HRI_001872900 [Hibiscus trionum]